MLLLLVLILFKKVILWQLIKNVNTMFTMHDVIWVSILKLCGFYKNDDLKYISMFMFSLETKESLDYDLKNT